MQVPVGCGTWTVLNSARQQVGVAYISGEGSSYVQRWVLYKEYRSPPFDVVTFVRAREPFASVQAWREGLGNGLWRLGAKYTWACLEGGGFEQAYFSETWIPVETLPGPWQDVGDPLPFKGVAAGLLYVHEIKDLQPAIPPPQGDFLFARCETWHLKDATAAAEATLAIRLGGGSLGGARPTPETLGKMSAVNLLCYVYSAPPQET